MRLVFWEKTNLLLFFALLTICLICLILNVNNRIGLLHQQHSTHSSSLKYKFTFLSVDKSILEQLKTAGHIYYSIFFYLLS